MSGPWTYSDPPIRDGGYVNWKADQQDVVQPNRASIVCIPFTHNWGPYKVAKLAQSWEEWQQIFGYDVTAGSMAVKQCFVGEGVSGYGGAGAVVSYRFGNGAGVAATATLSSVTPTQLLRLTAKYVGTRGNRLNVTVRTNAQNAAWQDLLIYDGQTMLESYTYVTAGATAIALLAAQINAFSGYVTATALADNATIVNQSATALATGTDGGAPLAADYTAMLTAVTSERFSIFVAFDNTDSSIQASITAWSQGLNLGGKRVDVFSGGALNEIASTAITRAGTINDPNNNTVGVGGVVDFGCVGTPVAPVILSPSQLAPRLAGIFAARGGIKPLTYARLAGTDFRYTTALGTTYSVTTASDSDHAQCIQGGVISISRDSNALSPLRLEKGITTWQTGNTDADRPYKIYKNPRYVKIMQDFEMALVDFVEQQVITPGLPLTQATKEFVIGWAMDTLSIMNLGGLIQTGYTVDFDTTIPTTPDDDFLAVVYDWKFTRSVEQVRNTIRVS